LEVLIGGASGILPQFDKAPPAGLLLATEEYPVLDGVTGTAFSAQGRATTLGRGAAQHRWAARASRAPRWLRLRRLVARAEGWGQRWNAPSAALRERLRRAVMRWSPAAWRAAAATSMSLAALESPPASKPRRPANSMRRTPSGRPQRAQPPPRCRQPPGSRRARTAPLPQKWGCARRCRSSPGHLSQQHRPHWRSAWIARPEGLPLPDTGRQSGAPVPRAAAPWTSRPCAPAPCAAAAPARWGRRQTCWRGSRCPRKESGCSESALRAQCSPGSRHTCWGQPSCI